MKRTVLFLSILLVASSIHAQKVFKQYGVDKEPMTLSKGRYVETFPNEEVMRVGTVLLNTKTNKVVEFLDEETADIAYKEEYSSRFVTMDPMAEKYPWMSPYAFCANNPVRYIDPDGRDWIEDKDGNAQWKKEYTKDNVPEGYKYMGTEYMGISITDYKTGNYQHKDGYYSSLELKIAYTDPDGKEYNNLNWIQTVERDKSGKPFVDYGNDADGQANYPYYQDKYENKYYRNQDGSDIEYYDKPMNRNAANANFSAELSLIADPTYDPNLGMIGRPIYAPVVTLTYGYSVKNGQMSTTPIKIVTPSSFQRKTIQQIK